MLTTQSFIAQIRARPFRGIKYQDKFAFFFQAGADFDISKKVFFNIDLKKVLLNTTATVDASNLTLSGSPGWVQVL